MRATGVKRGPFVIGLAGPAGVVAAAAGPFRDRPFDEDFRSGGRIGRLGPLSAG
jgi:hypothetical protein